MAQLTGSSPRIELNRIMLILEEFRKVNPEMTLQQAMTLLWVAAEPGETVTNIAKHAGLGLAATSRHVEVLGPHRPSKNIGFGLIVDDFDANDRRKKVLNLSPKGQRVINSLINIISK